VPLDARAARELWERHSPDLIAIIIAATAVPLVLGWVPPNRWYGFRTPLSMASSEAWYSANQILGLYMLGSQLFAVLAKHRVVAYVNRRWPCDHTVCAVLWVCAAALIGIAASVAHVYARM